MKKEEIKALTKVVYDTNNVFFIIFIIVLINLILSGIIINELLPKTELVKEELKIEPFKYGTKKLYFFDDYEEVHCPGDIEVTYYDSLNRHSLWATRETTCIGIKKVKR